MQENLKWEILLQVRKRRWVDQGLLLIDLQVLVIQEILPTATLQAKLNNGSLMQDILDL